MTPKTAILSVCYNDEAKLTAFIDNMQQWINDDYCWVLIDNGSTDNSVTLIRGRCPNTIIIEMKGNEGTTGGWNCGIRKAQEIGTEFVMFLSLDVSLAPDCVSVLEEEMRSNPEIGVIGPLLLQSHNPDVIESMGFALNRSNWLIEPNYYGCDVDGGLPLILDVAYVDGGTSLFRLSALRAVGGLDEQLFMYAEDFDVCLRLNHSGYRVAVTSKTRAWHRHTELRMTDSRARPHEIYYTYRNIVYVVGKHASLLQRGAFLLRLTWTLPRYLAYFAIRRREPCLIFVYVEAIVHGLLGVMGRTKYIS